MWKKFMQKKVAEYGEKYSYRAINIAKTFLNRNHTLWRLEQDDHPFLIDNGTTPPSYYKFTYIANNDTDRVITIEVSRNDWWPEEHTWYCVNPSCKNHNNKTAIPTDKKGIRFDGKNAPKWAKGGRRAAYPNVPNIEVHKLD